MKYQKMVACLVAVAFAGGIEELQADVKMSPLFGDHMVLQQGIALPVWGTAGAGEKVTVTVGTENGSATADADGKWLVKLAPLPAGTTPVEMTVTGKNSLKFEDVLVGDVWVCSGQSNMEYGVKNMPTAAKEIPEANVPLLRLFFVPKKTAVTPQTEMTATPPTAMMGHWVVCTPETIVQAGGWGGFSAVGYFFGREIQKTTGQPVGLIGSYWGGTPAQAWTSLTGLQKESVLQAYAQSNLNYIAAAADYPTRLAAYQADLAKWKQDVEPAYNTALKDWNDAIAQAKTAGQPPPPKPQPASPAPRPPVDASGGQNAPTTLFNGMISPLIPFAIKGVIWYQGESNAGAAMEYRTLFARMITDWREKWSQGDFPFLYVQLAGYGPGKTWPLLRESQLKTLALPNTGMASAVDIGDMANIHPGDKLDVGLRLALAAKHVAYGKDLVYSGPIYDKMQVEGNAIRLSFTQVGGGLTIGAPPAYGPGSTPPPADKLVGFVVAAADQKWFPAEATIDGKTIVVSSAQVPSPVAVRYAWEAIPPINFYNKDGLPASPFRTDDWPEPTPPPKVPAAATPPAPPAPTSAPAVPPPASAAPAQGATAPAPVTPPAPASVPK